MIPIQDRNVPLTPDDLRQRYNLDELDNLKKDITGTKNVLITIDNELQNFKDATVGDIEDLKDQVDGKITTWFLNGVPTLENEPAINWTTDEEKTNHIKDIYFDKSTGYVYYFTDEFEWLRNADQDVVAAMSLASSAFDTADTKRRIFLEVPYLPYDSGDLWIKDNEIFICQISKGTEETFEENDFINSLKYTDDTLATEVDGKITIVSGKVTTIEQGIDEITQTVESNRYYEDEAGELHLISEATSSLKQTVGGFTQSVENMSAEIVNIKDDITNIELQRPFYRYSVNANGSGMTTSPQADTKYLGTYVGITASTNYLDYTWALIKGADGVNGADGSDGSDGVNGTDGTSGIDGKTLWLAYADNIDDFTGFSIDGADSGKDFYGMYVGLTQSLTPTDYEWYPSNFKIENELENVNNEIENIDTKLTNVDNALNIINNTMQTIESTILTQTESYFQMWFEQTQIPGIVGNIQDLADANNADMQTLSQYIRFVEGNIELGKSDSNVKLIIKNDRIAFMTGSSESAYITNNKLYITDSTILTRLQVGQFVDEIDQYGNLNTKWVN